MGENENGLDNYIAGEGIAVAVPSSFGTDDIIDISAGDVGVADRGQEGVVGDEEGVERVDIALSGIESQIEELKNEVSSGISDLEDMQAAVADILEFLAPSEEPIEVLEVESVNGFLGVSYDNSDSGSYSKVTYDVNNVTVVFPSDYAGNLLLSGTEIQNYGNGVTVGAVIGGSGLSNYIVSEITIPTYHSATWYQYLYTYGQPYRVIDRYRTTTGSYGSSTRASVNLSWSGGNDWAGFSMVHILLMVIISILVLGHVFRKDSV